jgi:hypothetical protein
MIATKTGKAQSAICWMVSTKTVSLDGYVNMNTASTEKTQAGGEKPGVMA